jgi:hypothetical protein
MRWSHNRSGGCYFTHADLLCNINGQITGQKDVTLPHADLISNILQQGQITDQTDFSLAHADLLPNIPRRFK